MRKRNASPRLSAAVGVSFQNGGKVYFFEPNNIAVEPGEHVLAKTERGVDIGEVVLLKYKLDPKDEEKALKPLLRRATRDDLLREDILRRRARAALRTCEKKVEEHGLPMKLISADYTFDGQRLIFYFSSETRVDFRALVRDLAETFACRIELRQIGVRDEAKMIGGLGPCGRRLCCITHLTEFTPVSIKMAKQQDLPLSPMEISGLCGRLLCCLSYEDGLYEEAKSKMPKPGEIIDTPHGKAKVLSPNVIKQSLMIELESGVTTEVAWSPEGVTPITAVVKRPALEEPVEVEEPAEATPPAAEPAPRPSGKSRRRRRRHSASEGRSPRGSEKR